VSKKILQKVLSLIGIRRRKKDPPVWDNCEDFKRLYAEIKGKTLVPVDKCFMIYQFARIAGNKEGAFAEIGVYKGGTAKLTAHACPDKPIHLFDTFEGMPDSNESIDYHKKGDFADTSLSSVQSFMSDCPNAYFHPGFFPDTAETISGEYFSFVYIDTDIYQSVMDCLVFFYPRMVTGGIMVFDDYEWPYCQGVEKAINEFFADKKEIPVITARHQCAIFVH